MCDPARAAYGSWQATIGISLCPGVTMNARKLEPIAPVRTRSASWSVEPTVIALSNDVSVATFRNVVLCHFRGETPPSCVGAVRSAVWSLPPEQRVLFWGIIETTSTPPDQEARRRFTSFFEEHSNRLAGMIVTYFGEGFRGAVVRAVVSGIVNLAPMSRFAFPRHVVANLDEAAMLAERLSPELDRAALLQAFRTFSVMRPEGAR
jgi:hypothetical protein